MQHYIVCGHMHKYIKACIMHDSSSSFEVCPDSCLISTETQNGNYLAGGLRGDEALLASERNFEVYPVEAFS